MDDLRGRKDKALRAHGTLNPRPGDVADEMFQQGEFFDPRDLVQVKYEMLRRVRVEGRSVTAVAKAFGFSRVAFYQARAAFEAEGLCGLLPKRRGPKRAHKLTDVVLRLIEQRRAEDRTIRATALAELVRQRFGFSVHPRTIDRALARRRKRGR